MDIETVVVHSEADRENGIARETDLTEIPLDPVTHEPYPWGQTEDGNPTFLHFGHDGVEGGEGHDQDEEHVVWDPDAF